MNITSPVEIDLLTRALQRYRKEQVSKKIKYKNGDWDPNPGAVETIESNIRLTDDLLSRFVGAVGDRAIGEAVVTRKVGRYA